MKWNIGDIISFPLDQSPDLFQILAFPDAQNIDLENLTWDTPASFTKAFVDAYGTLVSPGSVNQVLPPIAITPVGGGCLLALLGIR